MTYNGERIHLVGIPAFKNKSDAQEGRKFGKSDPAVLYSKGYINLKYYKRNLVFASTHADIYSLSILFQNLYEHMLYPKGMDHRFNAIYDEMFKVMPSCDPKFDESYNKFLNLEYYIEKLDELLAVKDLKIIVENLFRFRL